MTRTAIVIEFDTPQDPRTASKAIFESVKGAFDEHERFGVPEGGVKMYTTVHDIAEAVMVPIKLHQSLVPPSSD